MKSRALAVFLLLLSLVHSSLSAGEGKDYYLAQHLTDDNGLPQNSVKSIATDENGFIWLATESALVRYDGRKLKVYNKDNIKLRSGRFDYILSDKEQHCLYAINEFRQILEIRKSQVLQSHKTLPDIIKPVIPINPYTKGGIGDFVFYHQEREDIRDSFQMSIDARRSIVIYNDNSIQWNNPAVPRRYFDFSFNIYQFITCKGTLYYLKNLDTNGLLEITQDKVNPVILRGSQEKRGETNFRVYANNATGDVFLLTGQHLYLLQQQQDKSLRLQLLLDDPLLKEVETKSFHYDTVADRIFIGTSISGLYIFEHKEFRAMTAEEHKYPDAFYGQKQVRNVFYGQMLWNDHTILTGKGHLFSENKPAAYLDKVGQHSDEFGSVIQRYKDGTIWTGVRKKLYRFSADGKHLLSSWDLKAPFLIYQGHGGVLWLGTNRNGIYQFYPDSLSTPRLFIPLNEYVTCLYQETENILWVGTTTNLYRLHLKERKWDTIQPLKDKYIRSLYYAGSQELWITTYEDGIYLWKAGKVTHLPTDRNNFLKNTHCILEDNNHYFWITTNNGLFQAAKADLLRFAAGKQNSVYYHHYKKEKGFNTNEFNGGGCQPCGIKFNAGNSFSFPSLNGLVWFSPANIRPVLPNNPVILDAVQIDGMETPVADTLSLPDVSSRVSIWIATAYLGNPNNLGMEYMIEGPGTGQDTWNPLVNDFISFNSPGSGTFVLTVRKQSGFGADNYVYKKIFIIIPKAFWETWWFLCLLAMGGAGLVFLLIRIRVRYLLQYNKELEHTVSLRTKELQGAVAQLQHVQQGLHEEVKFQRQLNASITHDIKTPIQYLTLSLKYLSLRKEREQAPDAQEMTEIFQASERISHFTNSLTGYIKVRLGIEAPLPIVLHQIAERKIAMFSVSADKAGNTFINNIPADMAMVTQPPLIDIILHNLIDNANKYTHEGIITINAKEEEDRIILKVSDSGKGMQAAQVESLNLFFAQKIDPLPDYTIGIGYLTIADTLERLKGSIAIESAPGRGTTITLALPHSSGTAIQ